MTSRFELTYGTLTPRLPTRCPACKGALIQRMPTASHGTFISFLCLFCQHSWKFQLEDPSANATGEVSGQVFIVTKRRVKQKLGGVEVRAIPEDALKKHLESRAREGQLETEKLQRSINGLAATLRTSQAEEDRLWKIVKADETDSKNVEAWSVVYRKTNQVAKQLDALKARRQYLASGEYFYDGLPSGISVAKTDADGKFALVIPRRGRYGVVASASFERLTGTETCFWFLWVTLEGHHSKRLMLTNDNMIDAGSRDSALHVGSGRVRS